MKKITLSKLAKIISILIIIFTGVWWAATLSSDVKHLIAIVEPLTEMIRNNENRITVLEVLAGIIN